MGEVVKGEQCVVALSKEAIKHLRTTLIEDIRFWCEAIQTQSVHTAVGRRDIFDHCENIKKSYMILCELDRFNEID